jgi:hypothetical protein
VAAVAYPMSDPWVATAPRRPDSAGRWGRHDQGVYRRRRAVALLALVVVALVAAIVVRPALAGSGGGALTATGASGAGTDGSTPAATARAARPPLPAASAAPTAAAPRTASAAQAAGSHVYVVQPGDTIWSIVQGSGHRGDPRPVVDRIALQLNGRALQPGQRLLIP